MLRLVHLHYFRSDIVVGISKSCDELLQGNAGAQSMLVDLVIYSLCSIFYCVRLPEIIITV